MTSTLTDYKLFTPLTIGQDLVLKNRIVHAPMTRARADKTTHVPTAIMQTYYDQRTGAGLVIAESTAISEQGFGWNGVPAIYNDDQVEGWKTIVERVHAKGSKIFLQLWHMGRQAHPSFNSKQEVVSASAIPVPSGIIRDANGVPTPYSVPRALEADEIFSIAEDYGKAAAMAKKAGFDGVEIHGANGYLVDQFLQSVTNKRTDIYGGSFENRTRFLLDVIQQINNVYPSDRIGVRLSPNGSFGGMGSEDNPELFTYVFQQLSTLNLAYLAILDGFGFGYHDKARILTIFNAKQAFKGTIIANNSYTRDIAEGAIRSGAADAVSFGRLYIANPDLAERFENDWPLNAPASAEALWDSSKGPVGYIDFPSYDTIQ